jgi:hypothetical protein
MQFNSVLLSVRRHLNHELPLRFPGTLRPFSLHAITLSPYCHRRCAVARAMPNW